MTPQVRVPRNKQVPVEKTFLEKGLAGMEKARGVASETATEMIVSVTEGFQSMVQSARDNATEKVGPGPVVAAGIVGGGLVTLIGFGVASKLG